MYVGEDRFVVRHVIHDNAKGVDIARFEESHHARALCVSLNTEFSVGENKIYMNLMQHNTIQRLKKELKEEGVI